MRHAARPIALALAAAALAAAAPAPEKTAPRKPAAPKAVSFKTKDGWTIAALYRAPKPGKAVLVLAHGVGSSKAEWDRLAELLAAKGVGTLALDLRGHSGSQKGPAGPQAYLSFDSVREWPKASADLLAAAAWLRVQGVPDARIAFGGASIGANLAAAAAFERRAAPFLLLLSAAGNYRDVLLKVRPGLKTLAAAAPSDAYSYLGTRDLAAAQKSVTALYAPAGHGVQMLDDPKTLEDVAAWIVKAGTTR